MDNLEKDCSIRDQLERAGMEMFGEGDDEGSEIEVRMVWFDEG